MSFQTLTFENLRVYPGSDGREIAEATAKLYRDGEYLLTLQPRRDFFITQQQPMTVPAVYSTLDDYCQFCRRGCGYAQDGTIYPTDDDVNRVAKQLYCMQVKSVPQLINQCD